MRSSILMLAFFINEKSTFGLGAKHRKYARGTPCEHASLVKTLSEITNQRLRPSNYNQDYYATNPNAIGFDKIEVGLEVIVERMSVFNEQRMTFTADVTTTQSWHDHRLAFLVTTTDEKKKSKSEEQPSVMETNTRFMLWSPNGTVWVITRVADLEKVSSSWNKQIFAYPYRGLVDQLRLEVQYERSLTFFILEVYIPCYVLIGMSWLGFWLSHKEVVVRMVLCMGTIVLWLMLKISVVVHRHPKVLHVTSFHVFIGVTFIFIILPLFELILVSRLDTRYLKRTRPCEQDGYDDPTHVTHSLTDPDTDATTLARTGVMNRMVNRSPRSSLARCTTESLPLDVCPDCGIALKPEPDLLSPPKPSMTGKHVDYFCRLVFPICYVITQLVYWAYLRYNHWFRPYMS